MCPGDRNGIKPRLPWCDPSEQKGPGAPACIQRSSVKSGSSPFPFGKAGARKVSHLLSMVSWYREVLIHKKQYFFKFNEAHSPPSLNDLPAFPISVMTLNLGQERGRHPRPSPLFRASRLIWYRFCFTYLFSVHPFLTASTALPLDLCRHSLDGCDTLPTALASASHSCCNADLPADKPGWGAGKPGVGVRGAGDSRCWPRWHKPTEAALPASRSQRP